MITVVGSLNLDLFVETCRLPAPGETVLGRSFRREPGGKGANQACAAARLNQTVALIGAVGCDSFGQELVQNLLENHVDVTYVARHDNSPTGTAFIVVDAEGQNQIVVNSGANATLSAEDVRRAAPLFRNTQAVLTQLESPPEAVDAALHAARNAGALAVLNPAPYRPIPAETLRLCDWIVPNALEAGSLTQSRVLGVQDAARAARVLAEQTKGAGIAITLGAAGVWIETKTFRGHIPGFQVKPIDTVAAGDAFIGALVCRLVEGAAPAEAASFACAAAALSVTRRGAQASLPLRQEVTVFLPPGRVWTRRPNNRLHEESMKLSACLVGLVSGGLAGWVIVAGRAATPSVAPVHDPSTNARPRFKLPKSVVPGFRQPRPDPATVAIGERLFLETRFSQFFHARSKGDANVRLDPGDPVVDTITTTGQALPGPFRGLAINCRSCHFVNEFFSGAGNRTYADFARRSPIPVRADGKTVTTRNAPPMVNATIPREHPVFLHFDGEFSSGEDLVKATLTGRNFGWLPGEQDSAVRHIAHVIRQDDGQGPLAADFGGYSYRKVFAGGDPELGEEGDRFQLPDDFRLDVSQASDSAILDRVARLMTEYMDSLFFSRDERAEYDSAPYDWFLETNQIPRKPDPGQGMVYYNRNVLDLIRSPAPLRLSKPGEMRFKTLKQPFTFGPQEVLGMKIFFTMARYATNSTRQPKPSHGIGNCVVCHPAPDFTDFKFHNTGASQEEYDSIHGAGAFGQLRVPDLGERNAAFNDWLPATAQHPQASGPFLDIPSKEKPGRADLGLWNVFANPDLPGPQPGLRAVLHGEAKPRPDDEWLAKTVALFKTPSLRGLGLSDPYLHTGRKDTIEEVIQFYARMSNLARAGSLRNAAPELTGIFLKDEDVAPLAAFLRALNEDYE